MRLSQFISIVLLLTGGVPLSIAATTIKEDSSGAILAKATPGSDKLSDPIAFDQLTRDPVYVNIKTPAGELMHIEATRVVKFVFYLKRDSFPTEFVAEDLAVIKAKLEELRSFGARSPETEKLVMPEVNLLQEVYDRETAKYKQMVSTNSRKSEVDQARGDFDKKCELMRLSLLAKRDDLGRSEEIIKEMEPLESRSELIKGVLSKWNAEKNLALEMAALGKKIWKDALVAHPESFSPLHDAREIAAFPTEIRAKAIDLSNRLDEFRKTAVYPQLIAYCNAETPAYFLLNQLSNLVEKARKHQFDEAVAIGDKALNQIQQRQIIDPYTQIYATLKNRRDLAEEIRLKFINQLAKAKQAENEDTNRELLLEYQKAYEIIPDEKVATRIEQIKQKIKSE